MKTKTLSVIITLMAIASWLPAQITVTNAVFPAAGDSLKTATDFSPEGVMISATGGPYTWDFSTLIAEEKLVNVFSAASEGDASASYPNAELVVISDGAGETYYDITATTFSVLGISGGGGLGLPIDSDLKFAPPLQELHAPLTFPSAFNTQAALNLALSTDAIPDGVLDSLGVPSGFLDSIRVRLTIVRNDFVDAYGTLAIPGDTYDVLRQKRTEYSDTRIEIHIPFLGWQDVTDLLPIPGFGQDTTISYQFISNTEKEPIAVVTMDSTGLIVETVDFKDNGITSSSGQIQYTGAEVVVSPNPAGAQATFELKNLPAGKYTLHLFDAHGGLKLLHQFTSIREEISLQSLSEGLYFYQILDTKKNTVISGRLVKLGL